MSQPTPAVIDRRWLVAGAVGYGLLLWLLLPAGVIAINDDFSYLRSVVQTIQHGRPWTDDWLAPWSASFSSLAAILFWTTGSFYFAVHGLLAALAAGSFAAAGLLLRQRGVGLKAAFVFVALGLTFPTVLWKTVEFTGVALYFPCLLLALWSGAQKRWGLFFLVWTLAAASRQSALVWLLIPLWSAGRALSAPRSDRVTRAWLEPLAVVVLGALVFWALDRGMNRTHVQALLTEHSFAWMAPRDSARVFGVGLFIYACAAGCGAFLLRGSGRNQAMSRVKTALGCVLLAVLLAVDERRWVQLEHTLLAGGLGWCYTKLVIAVGIAGWLRGGFRLRADYALFACGSLVLVSLRGAAWDYYLLDVAAFGVFGVAVNAESPMVSSPVPRWVLALFAGFHLLFLLDLKCTLDRTRALCVVSETALRAGKLQPAELSFAPFGFTAWHLYPHYVAHEGKTASDLAGFGRYLRPGAVEVGQGYSRMLHILPRFRHEPPADRHNLIASGRHRFAWFFHAEFFLLRFKTEEEQPAEVPLAKTEYKAAPFPLNDDEWRELIETPAR